MRRNVITIVIALALGAIIAATVQASVSGGGLSPSDNRKVAVENRNSAFNRAEAAYPDPYNVNFPMRKQLVEFTQREDKLNHPWYIYVLSYTGSYIGYYVAKFAPENSCNFLSSTEDIYSNDKGVVKMQSPSYDGVYYGQSACNEYFYFDYSTNALIKLGNLPYFVSDAPLTIGVKIPRITAR